MAWCPLPPHAAASPRFPPSWTILCSGSLGALPTPLREPRWYLSQLRIRQGPLATPRAVLEIAGRGEGQQAEEAGGQHGVRHPGARGWALSGCCSAGSVLLPWPLPIYVHRCSLRAAWLHPYPVAPQEPTAIRSQAISSDSGVWGHTWTCLCRGWWRRGQATRLSMAAVTGAAVSVTAALRAQGEGHAGVHL